MRTLGHFPTCWNCGTAAPPMVDDKCSRCKSSHRRDDLAEYGGFSLPYRTANDRPHPASEAELRLG